MKSSIRIFSFLVASFWAAVLPANAQVNVTQEHNNVSRDGVYIDAGFTPSAAANLTRDLNFNGTISGAVYAQPLYIEGGPNGPMVIAVTETNNVYALNATTGLPIWSRTDIGSPVQTTPCGGFNPTGITGTPVVDLSSRRLFFDALISGSPNKHWIYSLDVDTGATTPGWPVDLNATVVYNGINPQNFRTLDPDEQFAKSFETGGKKVLGFVGSFYRYEGLDLLVKAFAELCKTRDDLVLLLVGGGEMERELREQVERMSLQSKVVIPGRFPHEDIPRIYSLIDILVYPRYSMRLTELVTPLKPLEAMAMSKALVASDIGGHRELIQNESTGLLFRPGDVSALATRSTKPGRAISDLAEFAEPRQNGRAAFRDAVGQRHSALFVPRRHGSRDAGDGHRGQVGRRRAAAATAALLGGPRGS